jgi:hypothetical protein
MKQTGTRNPRASQMNMERDMPDTAQHFAITPGRLARVLCMTLAFLFAMHGLTLFVAYGLGYPVAKGFVPAFNVDFENNFPTFVAFLILIACGLVSAWSSAAETRRPRHRRAWALVAFLFLLLAADEAFTLHEQLGEFLFAEFGALGLPMFAWVVPYGIAVVLLGAFLLRWFLELERPVQISLFLAGFLFIGGAIGLELVASAYYEALPVDRPDFRTLGGDLLATLEEASEFAGASYFLFAVVRRLGGVIFN